MMVITRLVVVSASYAQPVQSALIKIGSHKNAFQAIIAILVRCHAQSVMLESSVLTQPLFQPSVPTVQPQKQALLNAKAVLMVQSVTPQMDL